MFKKFLALTLLVIAPLSFADNCKLTIEGNDQMQFNTKSLTAPASCKEVTVTLKHTGKLKANVMGHNWALAEAKDFQGIAAAGAKAGAANNYLPKGDKKVLAHTKVIGGGESTSVTFKTAGLKGKSLKFFCSFPGHWAIMNGDFKIQ